MHIGGLQKLTLLDYPGRVACTLFLPSCNLRCPFCHNPSLVLPERMEPEGWTEQAVLDFLGTRRGKLDGVCITGGEPTMQKDLPELIRKIRAMGFSVKLDTNGTHPAVLKNLMAEGLLDYVAMDIKNCPEYYSETVGGMDILNPVRESVRLLMEGDLDYEFRTTVCRPFHTMQRMTGIGRWLRGAKRYFIQNFIDSGDLVGRGITPVPQEEMEKFRLAVLPYIPDTSLRGI